MTVFPFYPGTKAVVYNGLCLDLIKQMPDNSIDSIVTDPPYGLSKEPDMAEVMRHWLNGDDYVHTGAGFMGKSWDSFVPGPSVWRECFRVLKPGGHLLSFAGSRTHDLMGLAIRLAGFEIRDSIAWLYSSGFPKSLDVSKAIEKAAGAEREVLGVRGKSGSVRNSMAGDFAGGEYMNSAPATDAAQQWEGWGTALKPAFEPIVVGRKPFPGTVAANVLEYGTGALNIDACRIEGVVPEVPRGKFGGSNDNRNTVGRNGEMREAHPAGRWPTNVVLDESQAAELDKQTGISTSGMQTKPLGRGGIWSTQQGEAPAGPQYGDSGGASRFFPVFGFAPDEKHPDARYPDTNGNTWAKARREHLIAPAFKYQAKAPAKERPKDADGKGHPTVKPLELLRWLVRLVTPSNGVVLEPFAGSGTTVEAALLEGFHCVAIENEADYLPLIFQRIQRATPGLGEVSA